MFKKSLAALSSAILLTAAVSAPAFAAGQASPAFPHLSGQAQPVGDQIEAPQTDVTGTSRRAGRQQREQRGRQQQAAAAPTAEENVAAAQAIATAAGSSCQVSEANFLGQTPDGARSYEAACATGPGFILMATTPPQAVDCVLLAGQAEIDRARDPAAVLGTQCVIPQNADVLRVVSTYATEAGIRCSVDQGASIGKSTEGNLIYEVGCNGADGFWIEKVATGWKSTECAIISTQNATCRYSTAAEQNATLKTRVTGSDAAPCDVTESRYMGANANGSFWEAKCGAGNGLIVRFNTDYVVQQVYPCETAQRIGGGCRLTIVPEAPAAAAPAAQ